jgi:hypothetical protein
MDVIRGIFGIIFLGIIVGLPLRLIFRNWKDSTIAYLTAGILCVIVLFFKGSSQSPLSIVDVITGTLIAGTGFWGLMALYRKIFKISQPVRKSKSSEGYVICPKCGLEQWNGYQNCQKCGCKLDKAIP